MNHAFVITKKLISQDLIERELESVVKNRWGNCVSLNKDHDNLVITIPGFESKFYLQVWLKSRRTIEMRKGSGDISSWLQTYVQCSLAKSLDGKCGDEGVNEKWVGDPDSFRSFSQWWKHIYKNLSEFTIDDIYSKVTKDFPRGVLG